jgi:hypothetical protein
MIIPPLRAGQAIKTSSPQVQQIFTNSEKLRRLLGEVKSYGYVDVVITQDLSRNPEYQGSSHPISTSRGMVYDIHISSGSDAYVEALIAHELYHATLRHEGFASGSATIMRGPELSENDLKMLESQIGILGDCYLDAVIDRRTAKLGFKPQLLQDDAKSNLIALAPVIPPTASNNRSTALFTYCISIRLRNFDMSEIYAAYKSAYPNLAQDVRVITNTVGPELCDTRETCFRKMLVLRKAVGLEGQVKFPGPLTNKDQ